MARVAADYGQIKPRENELVKHAPVATGGTRTRVWAGVIGFRQGIGFNQSFVCGRHRHDRFAGGWGDRIDLGSGRCSHDRGLAPITVGTTAIERTIAGRSPVG